MQQPAVRSFVDFLSIVGIPYYSADNTVTVFDCLLRFDQQKNQVTIKCALSPFDAWILPIISNKSILNHVSYVLSEVEKHAPSFRLQLN